MSIAPDALLARGAPAARPDQGAAPTGLPRRLVDGVRRRLLAVLIALALLAAGVVGVLWRGTGYTSAVTDLSSGAIWLANTNGGMVTMINGNTNEAVWRIPLAEPGAPLTTVQLDDGAAVLDHTTGALTRISTRTLTATATATATVEPGEAGFAAREGQLYLFPADAGLPVTRRDPATLASLGELAIPGGTDGVVDQDGRLWVLEAERATLHLVPADRPAVSRAIAGAETATLTPIAGGVALIRPDGAVTRATPAGEDNLTVRAEQLSITATGWSAVQAADELPDRLLLLDPDGARLGSCPASGDCTLISLAPYAGPTDAFGTAQYAGGVVFVPVHSTGQVILVDVATGTVRQQVPVVEQPAPFELTAARDAIWFNNPVTNEAGKINGDGTVTKILKYPDELDDSGVRALVAGGPGPIGRNEGIGAGGGTGTGPGGGADAGAIDTEAPDAPDTAETDDAAAVSTTTTAPIVTPPTTVADASTNPPVTSTTLTGPDGDEGGTDPDGAALPPTAPSGGASPSPSTGSTSTTVGSSPPPTSEASPPPADGDDAVDPAAPAKPLPTPGPNQTTEGQRRDEQPVASDVLEAKMALSSTSVEPGVELQLRDISTGDPDSRLWDFGDGTTATDAAPRHRWSRAGSYTITLTVRKGGAERTTRQPIQVTSELVASFTAPTTARVGEPVAFTNTSSGDITSYLWDFGDGTQSDLRSPQHVFRSSGRVVVRLVASGPNGNGSSAERYLDVAEPPTTTNQAPRLGRVTVSLMVGATKTVTLAELGATDPDGDPLVLTLLGGGTLPTGTAAAVEGLTLRISGGDVPGPGVVTVEVHDPNGASTTAQVTVEVVAAGVVPAPPTLDIYQPRYNGLFVHVNPQPGETAPITRYVLLVVETGKEYSNTENARVIARDLEPYVPITLVGFLENSNGRSEPSEPRYMPRVFGDPPPPPTALTASTSGTTVTLRWNAPTLPAGAPPITEYIIGVSPGNADYARVAGTSAALTLQPGTYEISVIASSLDGWSTPATATAAVSGGLPGAPRNGEFWRVPGASPWIAAWDAPATDGGAPITAYRIAKTAADPASSFDYTTDVGGSFVGPRFSRTVGYGDAPQEIRISAINAAGEGPPLVMQCLWDTDATFGIRVLNCVNVPPQNTTVDLSIASPGPGIIDFTYSSGWFWATRGFLRCEGPTGTVSVMSDELPIATTSEYQRTTRMSGLSPGTYSNCRYEGIDTYRQSVVSFAVPSSVTV